MAVRYAMTKETALAELYSLPAADSKHLFAPKPSDKKTVEPPMRLTNEQQTYVMGLLRFRVLEAGHFKKLFGQRS